MAADDDNAERRADRRRELIVRTVSALLLASIFVVATIAGLWAFAGLAILLAVAAAWEWAGVVRGRGADLAFLLQCLATIAAVVLLLLSQPWWALVLLAAGIAVVAMLAGGDQPLWTAAGVGYIGLPSLALVWLHGDSGNGMLAVLFLVVVVAAADIGAFVSGRSIGGPRLWPALSPNKTWAGFVGGVMAAALTAFGFALSIGHVAPLRMVAIAVPLAIIAAAGDLFESAVKRRFGKKDMSGLIPGHGGVLDRVDGLIVASMVAATAALLADAAHPAVAVLGWPAVAGVP